MLCVNIHVVMFGFVRVCVCLEISLPLLSPVLSHPLTLLPSQPAGSAFCWGRKAPLSHVIEILLPEVGGSAAGLYLEGSLGGSMLSVPLEKKVSNTGLRNF